LLQEHLTLELSQLAGHVSHFLQFLGRHVAAVLGVLIGGHLDESDVMRGVEIALTTEIDRLNLWKKL
jgi:hypothetical protein